MTVPFGNLHSTSGPNTPDPCDSVAVTENVVEAKIKVIIIINLLIISLLLLVDTWIYQIYLVIVDSEFETTSFTN